MIFEAVQNGQQLNTFQGRIRKRAIEKMLEAYLDGHSGYEKELTKQE